MMVEFTYCLNVSSTVISFIYSKMASTDIASAGEGIVSRKMIFPFNDHFGSHIFGQYQNFIAQKRLEQNNVLI